MKFATVKYGTGLARVIHPKEKIYTSHRRARIYGGCSNPSPCGGGFVALPWGYTGNTHIYLTGDEYARWMGLEIRA